MADWKGIVTGAAFLGLFVIIYIICHVQPNTPVRAYASILCRRLFVISSLLISVGTILWMLYIPEKIHVISLLLLTVPIIVEATGIALDYANPFIIINRKVKHSTPIIGDRVSYKMYTRQNICKCYFFWGVEIFIETVLAVLGFLSYRYLEEESYQKGSFGNLQVTLSLSLLAVYGFTGVVSFIFGGMASFYPTKDEQQKVDNLLDSGGKNAQVGAKD